GEVCHIQRVRGPVPEECHARKGAGRQRPMKRGIGKSKRRQTLKNIIHLIEIYRQRLRWLPS
ncbi:hypothetical protein JZU48_01180, partial [bacterium]|nr:hypothetical protein [bacterium]